MAEDQQEQQSSGKWVGVIGVVVIIGVLIAWAGSLGAVTVAGPPALAVAVAACFLIQWVAFAFAYARQTETFYDLTGALTYVTVTLGLLVAAPSPDARAWVLAGCVLLWAVRLGGFLFARVRRFGGDDRFDEIKPNFWRFCATWTIQALWVSLTAMAAWVAISSPVRPGGALAAACLWVGLVLWVAGFALETTADLQKWRFKEDRSNQGRFIRDGVWAWSRHPNYLGEITLWVGVFLVAAPVLRGWQWVAVLSPVFVTFLLTRVSGIPMLERKAEKRWGDDADYEEYKRSTPVLVPVVGRRG